MFRTSHRTDDPYSSKLVLSVKVSYEYTKHLNNHENSAIIRAYIHRRTIIAAYKATTQDYNDHFITCFNSLDFWCVRIPGRGNHRA